ncbi:unnamed protein product [Pleuronectes platessa]|uniref:Uncharacterized protein n=1 Tax=Pleuronectes platessa TaxID=8262 RepID=A0A9N7VYG9_PLEPL|nr:unnamed protein product [Pleuronectes platessa]
MASPPLYADQTSNVFQVFSSLANVSAPNRSWELSSLVKNFWTGYFAVLSELCTWVTSGTHLRRKRNFCASRRLTEIMCVCVAAELPGSSQHYAAGADMGEERKQTAFRSASTSGAAPVTGYLGSLSGR